MKENGGCRVWDWKTQHVEAMLVKLGMEERVPDEKTGSRRRRHKAAVRRQTSPQNGQHANANAMGDWSNGLGLHPHQGFQGHPHHMANATAAAGRQAHPFENMIPDDISTAPTFTSEQENEFIDQIYQKIKIERSLSPDDSMDLTYGNNNDRRSSTTAGHDLQHQNHNQHMARQACEQMVQQQQQ